MIKTDKDDILYKTIGQVAKELNLIDGKTGQVQTHTIRFWETQFNQIKPKVRAGGRRYYSKETIKVIKNIKFLLKEKGLKISGVKKLLEKDGKLNINIDDQRNIGINSSNLKSAKEIKHRLKNISKIVKDLKRIKNG